MEHLLENPETWILVAFVIFVALVAKKASLMIASALDARADGIRTELASAALDMRSMAGAVGLPVA